MRGLEVYKCYSTSYPPPKFNHQKATQNIHVCIYTIIRWQWVTWNDYQLVYSSLLVKYILRFYHTSFRMMPLDFYEGWKWKCVMLAVYAHGNEKKQSGKCDWEMLTLTVGTTRMSVEVNPRGKKNPKVFVHFLVLLLSFSRQQ